MKRSIKRELIQVANEIHDLVVEMKKEIISDEDFNFLRDFFENYERSYSLSLAYPEELWRVTAENAGINTEGKERLQLAKEVFLKASLEQGQQDSSENQKVKN